MEVVLLWCFVLAWMAKRGAEDLVHAVKGTPNPRYELKKAKAKAASQRPPQQPRYGGKEWWADLYSDALAAHTEKRRAAAKAKGQPVDDMVELVREARPVPAQRHPNDPNNTRNCPTCKGEVVLDGRPCPNCLAEQQRRNAEWLAEQAGRHETPEPVPTRTDRKDPPMPRQPDDDEPDAAAILARLMGAGGLNSGLNAPSCPVCGTTQTLRPDGKVTCACRPATDDTPTARIYQFPNPKHAEKEITMANSEVTGLSTAIAFADQASNAHTSFATTGAEGYVGALERGGNAGEVIASAREAMEASGIAADKWAAHRAKLEEQLNLKEGYQAQPDAADKEFLLNG